ncbi:hypothetical protein CLG96_05935 [Sphingomonas oleivorans]|uniref:Uncharacterized protein n=1 Tax=Sphingomonas oleivorans TaxID=1735121 RepID=A0A2T5FZH3_9SPHN|nr:hypothetical protein [Sphingomonas oleivorans]PTQ12104.1 hypothetical protein CLG96_05935 [Sphingomonas oleivorans]
MTLPPKIRSQQIWAWLFHFRLGELERAYRAARSTSDAERESLEQEWKKLEEAVARGEAAFVEEDEEGNVLFDHGDHAGDQISNVEGVLEILREAFTISLHHFWERELNRRLKCNHYSETDAIAHLKAEGLTPDEDGLKALRLTTNVAKHSAGKSADELWVFRPDLFDAKAMAEPGAVPSHEHLKITDEVLNSFFKAVRASGPERRRPF